MLIGNWNKAHRAITGLTDRVDKALADTMKEASLRMQKTWSQGLKNKDLGLQANAELTTSIKVSTSPLVDHGDLKNSIQIKKYGRGYFVGIQKNAKSKDGAKLFDIAMFHEFGGVIKPKKGKTLAIPMTRKASRAGSPRNYEGTLKFIPAKKGNYVGLLVEEKETKRTYKLIVAYLLKRKVIIPPRPHRLNAYKKFLSEYNIYEALQKRMVNKVL